MTESFERKDAVPNEAAIRRKIEQLTSSREYTEVRRLEDSEGVTMIEWKSTDESGDKMDIYFKRVGYMHGNQFAPTTSIEVAYYMGETMCGGEVKADFIDGVWVDR